MKRLPFIGLVCAVMLLAAFSGETCLTVSSPYTPEFEVEKAN